MWLSEVAVWLNSPGAMRCSNVCRLIGKLCCGYLVLQVMPTTTASWFPSSWQSTKAPTAETCKDWLICQLCFAPFVLLAMPAYHSHLIILSKGQLFTSDSIHCSGMGWVMQVLATLVLCLSCPAGYAYPPQPVAYHQQAYPPQYPPQHPPGYQQQQMYR